MPVKRRSQTVCIKTKQYSNVCSSFFAQKTPRQNKFTTMTVRKIGAWKTCLITCGMFISSIYHTGILIFDSIENIFFIFFSNKIIWIFSDSFFAIVNWSSSVRVVPVPLFWLFWINMAAKVDAESNLHLHYSQIFESETAVFLRY